MSSDPSSQAMLQTFTSFGLGFLEPESRDHLVQALVRVRVARRALVIAACPPAWRPACELVLALALLPDRHLRRLGPDHPEWDVFLSGKRLEKDGVLLIDGCHGEGWERTADQLNFHRDTLFHENLLAWIWLDPDTLGGFSERAPDLWRFRTLVLELKVPMSWTMVLPDPVAALPYHV